MLYIYFLFSSRRRHTRLQGDWSSDVCSSDLDAGRFRGVPAPAAVGTRGRRGRCRVRPPGSHGKRFHRGATIVLLIGREAWRGRVEIFVGVVSLKKKKHNYNLNIRILGT